MNEKVGSTIQTIATVSVIIGIIASIITGIVLMAADEDLVLTGLLIAVLGSVFFWISAVMTYGFGQLIENTNKLVKQNEKASPIQALAEENNQKSRTQIYATIESEEDKRNALQKNSSLKSLLEKGLITEEDYREWSM